MLNTVSSALVICLVSSVRIFCRHFLQYRPYIINKKMATFLRFFVIRHHLFAGKKDKKQAVYQFKSSRIATLYITIYNFMFFL